MIFSYYYIKTGKILKKKDPESIAFLKIWVYLLERSKKQAKEVFEMEKTELKQLIKYNIEVYKDFDEFNKDNNYTRDEFVDELERGFFQELTPCNGATILDVLKEEVLQDSFLELEGQLNEDYPERRIDLNNVNALVEDYSEVYYIFYIKNENRYFVDFD